MSSSRQKVEKILPALAVACAVAATLAVAGADRMAFELGAARVSYGLSETLGSFRGMGPSLEELEGLSRRAAVGRRIAWCSGALFVASAAAALWVGRGEARNWPWLSALYLAVALVTLYFGLRWLGPLWLLPLAVAVLIAALATVELVRQKRRSGRTSVVAWGALGVAAFATVVSVVGVR